MESIKVDGYREGNLFINLSELFWSFTLYCVKSTFIFVSKVTYSDSMLF